MPYRNSTFIGTPVPPVVLCNQSQLHCVLNTFFSEYLMNNKVKKLKSEMIHLGNKAGGAHLTREARINTCSSFCDFLEQRGIQISSVGQIGGRHLKAFIQVRIAKGDKPGTLANHMSAMRSVLREAGKASLANDPNYSNQALSIPARCRDGTKTELPTTRLNDALETCKVERGDGFHAMNLIAVQFGLRKKEAVMANLSQLKTWVRQLDAVGYITVTLGTKGGRMRNVTPLDLELARQTLQYAIASVNEDGYLVSMNNLEPTKGLEQALKSVSNYWFRRRVQLHTVRYRYARLQVLQLVEHQLMSEKLALATVSVLLGHGDGRGRYVKRVYLAGMAKTRDQNQHDNAVESPAGKCAD